MFDDLLAQLHSLSDIEKGRAFERLCRWYLESAPEYRAVIKRVWLWSDWPGRWGPDAGIDLIVETKSGAAWAVQAKAYAATGTVTKADVDSFLSESARPEIDFRLLIATTDRLSANAARALHAQDKPVGIKLLSQLRMEEVPWPSSLRQLRPRRPERKTPREHQKEAIQEVVRGLREQDRGQLLMACGTGKTLTSLWIDERLKSDRTLVLVPSLSLLGQTLRSWAANAKTPFEYLAVCSDDTVKGTDDFTAHTADLGFPVTTDADHIARFLRRRSGRRVVFSTYQSSPAIAQAQAQRGVPRFDVVFADEAHRCSGPVTSDFATVLDAKRIKATKRVFMTATPRYLSGRVQRAGAERDFEVVSMDDEAAFGTVLHKLSFGEAIKRDLLADYRVVVVGVDEPTYARYAEHGELVTRDGTTITDARTLARQIGLARAMRKFDLHRVISFHSRVAAAQRFADELPDVIDWMPRQARPRGALWTHHVSGGMNAGRRDALLDRFRQLDPGERGVLSNARCLAEGVDVPAIDGVAFVDPRRSTVDIIQAVGRAIRQAPDKTLGTIIIPVFIEPGMSDEEVLDDSAFKPVWDIVRALRAHDDVLANQLDLARQRLGREGGSADTPDKIILDVPRAVGAGFAAAFDAQLVERSTSRWEFWYGLLEHYVEREGHASPPSGHLEDGFRLGGWVVTQRTERQRPTIERARRLESLPGWVWNTYTAAWESGFAALQKFADREGHARPSARYLQDGYKLGSWVNIQRTFSDKLTAEQRLRLEALPGWAWAGEISDEKWDRGYASLRKYVSREGHARPPKDFIEEGFNLGSWVVVQRTTRDHLSPERIRALESLVGWAWNTLDARWEEGFAALKAYVKRTGNARPPGKLRDPDGYGIGTWVSHQRSAYLRGVLAQDRAARLELLPGWVWERDRQVWEENVTALRRFVEREGHANPLRNQTEDGLRLGQWVSSQRQNRDTLSDRKIRMLESVPGWAWKVAETRWEEHFVALKAYVQSHGHAAPEQVHMEGAIRLGTWVNTQRLRKRAGTIAPEQERRLEALPGWVWDATEFQGMGRRKDRGVLPGK